jgi:hypothetical protein
MFIVASNGAQLTFRSAFNLEYDGANVGFDGMVLEISINGGPFEDIVGAGGSFTAGGYNKMISSSFSSPIAGRAAWSGLSGGTPSMPGYITTTVNLPVSVNGQLARIKWRIVTDSNATAAGDAGVRIDSILGLGCGPTAAGVSLSGRVLTPDGRGLRNAIVSILGSDGVSRTVTTSSFGYYRFDEIEPGDTYVIGVTSRRYRYLPRAVHVTDGLTDLDFAGLDR